MSISRMMFQRVVARKVCLDDRVSSKTAYITIDLVHVSGELFASELFVDFTEAGVGDAPGRADGVGGVVESESPRVTPVPVPVWRLTNSRQVPTVRTLQYKKNTCISS